MKIRSAGQRLQLSDARVHGSQMDQDMAGQLDDEIRQLLGEQSVFLVISERNINMR